MVFVIDDLEGKLSDIVYAGLVASSEAGFAEVTLPTIRMGVMLGVVEKTPSEAVNEMVQGISRFIGTYSSHTSIKKITIVIFNGHHIQELFEKHFEKQPVT